MTAPRVAVVGAGAVGCWYGGMLARAGIPVTMIGRPQHVEAMRREGLHMSGAAFDEHVPVHAGTDVAEAAGAHLVLVCVKSTDTEATGAQLKAHVAPEACVLSLQNGVDNAARLAAALGRPADPAVVYVASEMAGPGHVRHLGRGELVIPADIAGGLPAAAVVQLFARAGVKVELSGNVPGALWSKLVLNCAYNAMSAIAGLPYGQLVQQPGVAQAMRDAVLECLAVAAAAGVTPEGDVFAAVERIAQTMPGQFSSTAQDLRRGKPSEIDHLNGLVVREGERLGVATPVNRALWALVKAIESRPSRAPAMELLKDVHETPEGPFALEGEVFCRPFGRYIALAVENAASTDYARRCAAHLDALPAHVLDALCEASIRYCNGFRSLVGEAPLAFETPRSVLELVDPNTLLIPDELGPEPVVHLELNCAWEPEHGLEWIVRGEQVLYVGGFNGGNPWADWSAAQGWNYA